MVEQLKLQNAFTNAEFLQNGVLPFSFAFFLADVVSQSTTMHPCS